MANRRDRNRYYQRDDDTFFEVVSPFRTYQQRYEQQHPEKVKEWRLHTYINALKREGYTILKEGDPV